MTQQKNNHNIYFFILFFFIFLFISFNRLIYHSEEKELKKDHILTTGYITYFGASAGGAVSSAQYTFTVDGVKYEEPFKRTSFCKKLSIKDKNKLKNLAIPVVYSHDDPRKSRLLISRSEYKKYNVECPSEVEKMISEYIECSSKHIDNPNKLFKLNKD